MARSELLREVARLYTRQQRHCVASCDGTSLTQCTIVTELGRAGDLSLGELAAAIGFDKSWTSRAVDALTAEGLVSKTTNTEDARKIRLALTKKGQARFQSVNRALDEHARRVLQHVDPARRQAVQNALAVLHDALRAQHEAEMEVACAR
jgi:DNA-binding MarR family transcriptional regulator